jgi:hypothetical protein
VTGRPVSFIDPFGLFGMDDTASMALDFVPVVGSCKGIIEFVIGMDPITGEPIPRWMAALGIIPFGKYFTKGGKVTYEIIDGVRRAKSAELLGNQTIRANIYKNNKLIDSVDIPIDSLLSPNKSSIDVSSGRKMDRFMNILNGMKGNASLPLIDVEAGCKGVKICDIQLDSLGEK